MNIYDMFKLLSAVSTRQLDTVAMYTHIYKYICICYICYVLYPFFKLSHIRLHYFHNQNKMNVTIINLHSSVFAERLLQACLRLGAWGSLHEGASALLRGRR